MTRPVPRLPFLLLLVAAHAQPAAAQQRVATAEDYAVYRAALASEPLAAALQQGGGPLVVDGTAHALHAEAVFLPQPMRLREGVDSSTVDAIREMRDEPAQLAPDSLGLAVRAVMLSHAANDSLFTPEAGVRGWDRFHARFGASAQLLELSRVAFNRERTQAVVEVTTRCGGRCGHGRTLLMERRDGRWAVQRAIVVTMY